MESVSREGNRVPSSYMPVLPTKMFANGRFRASHKEAGKPNVGRSSGSNIRSIGVHVADERGASLTARSYLS